MQAYKTGRIIVWPGGGRVYRLRGLSRDKERGRGGRPSSGRRNITGEDAILTGRTTRTTTEHIVATVSEFGLVL